MQASLYVINFRPDEMVATEMVSDEAAVALLAGQTLLVARPADLVRVALLHDRPLAILSRGETRPITSRTLRGCEKREPDPIRHTENTGNITGREVPVPVLSRPLRGPDVTRDSESTAASVVVFSRYQGFWRDWLASSEQFCRR